MNSPLRLYSDIRSVTVNVNHRVYQELSNIFSQVKNLSKQVLFFFLLIKERHQLKKRVGDMGSCDVLPILHNVLHFLPNRV